MEMPDVRRLLEEHHGSSFGWAMNCCGRNRDDAEEVLQLVYLKILEGKARYGGEASFKTWLFAVIRKTAAEERRRKLFRNVVSAVTADRLTRVRIVDPVTAFECSESQSRLEKALDQLSAKQRATLHLVLYQELTLQETADVIGISVGAVRQHYARAKKRLRDLLADENKYGIEWRREKNPSAVS